MKILVLYCEEGEGHAAAARALADELEHELPRAEVVVADALADGMGRVIPFFSRDLYRVQVRSLRWTYGVEYAFFARFPPGRAFARWGLGALGSRPLRRLVDSVAADLIVSTHPSVTNVLGRLRRQGRVAVPVVATITDFGVHPLWANRHVDLHLVMHERCVDAVARVAGAESVRVARAPVAPAFRASLGQQAARVQLGLPVDETIVVISGGGWGVGDVVGAVAAVAGAPGVCVVCLSGRNEVLERRLRDRFGASSCVHVVSFTSRIDEYLAAADLLVDATVGVTCLEALTVGCGIVVYGVPPGHSRFNAKMLVSLGLAQRARSASDLRDIVASARLRSARPARLAVAPSSSSLIRSARLREATMRSTRGRRVATLAASGVASLLLAGWTFASPTTYPLVARTFDVSATTHVRTRDPVVAVVVDAPEVQRLPALARALAALRLHASFAASEVPGGAVTARLRAQGDDLLPALPRLGPTKLITGRRRFESLARRLGYRRRFYYLVPSRGFTLAEYVVARTAGGEPVQGAVVFDVQGADELGSLARGAIVVVKLDGTSDDLAAADALESALHARGLRAVPLSRLLGVASSPSSGSEVASKPAPEATHSSAAIRPAARAGEVGQPSPTISGADATGTNVVRENTSGATCVTRQRCSADISLRVPIPEARFIARNHAPSPTQR